MGLEGYLGTNRKKLGFGDTANIDASGRLRTSNPQTVFESQHQYNESPQLWDQKITNNSGSAAITHLPNHSGVELKVGDNDTVIFQTFEYFRYQPGKSVETKGTFVLGTPIAGVTRLYGYGDASNGLFIKQTGTGVSFVRRSKASGSVVEEEIPQSEWNIDVFASHATKNPSGIKIFDQEALQQCVIDFEWLSAGRVRCGFKIGGMVCYTHAFFTANVKTEPFMTTANLPLRYEISQVTGTGGTNTFEAICSTIISEGGHSPTGLVFSIDNNTTGIALTTTVYKPILALRPKLTFNSITNRGTLEMSKIEFFAQNQDCNFRVYLNPVGLTGASMTFTSVNINSIAEFADNMDTFTSGTIIDSTYLPSGGGGKSSEIGVASVFGIKKLTSNIDGDETDIILVTAKSIGNNALGYASFHWVDEY